MWYHITQYYIISYLPSRPRRPWRLSRTCCRAGCRSSRGTCAPDPHPCRSGPRTSPARHLGDSKNTVRGYCLDIPRFEESLSNEQQHNSTRNKVPDSRNGTKHILEISEHRASRALACPRSRAASSQRPRSAGRRSWTWSLINKSYQTIIYD